MDCHCTAKLSITRLQNRRGFAGFVLVAMLCATIIAACTPTLREPVLFECALLEMASVSHAAQPVRVEGFTIRPPVGEHWCIQEESENQVVFVTHLLSGEVISKRPTADEVMHTFGLMASAFDFEDHDPQTAEQLRQVLERWLRVGGAAKTVGDRRVLQFQRPPRFRHVRSHVVAKPSPIGECVEYESQIEERDNPEAPGKVLLLDQIGTVCLNPDPRLSAVAFVVFSERRVRDSPTVPALRESLSREATGSFESLRFVSQRTQ